VSGMSTFEVPRMLKATLKSIFVCRDASRKSDDERLGVGGGVKVVTKQSDLPAAVLQRTNAARHPVHFLSKPLLEWIAFP
jgi:hypothetical protein